ncbi:MAG: MFS transporter [Halolamina sp.]
MTDQPAARERLPFSRWWLVAVAALAMGAAGTYQFVWSSIRGPLGSQVGASEATLGTLFTLLIVAQTLSQFPAGWVRDRYGPRIPLLVGGLLLTAGYGAFAVASTAAIAAAAVVVGGSGAGTVYTVAVNTPVKWFDERRGLATGIVTMTYSGLSVALIPAIRGGVAGTFQASVVVLGGIVAAACLVAAFVVRDPGADGGATTDEPDVDAESHATDIDAESHATDVDAEPRTIDTESPQYGWREVVRTRQFWTLYVVFAVINGVGLMLIEKAIAFAAGLGLSGGVATAAASVIAFGDSAGVIVGGGLADRFDPERTVGAALVLGAAAIVGAIVAGGAGVGVAFVVLVGAAAFFRSPAFAVFPGLVGEYYGTAHSSENYAVLYTGKLWGSVFGGAATSVLVAALGWSQSFLLGAGLLVLAGLAMFSVRPVDR